MTRMAARAPRACLLHTKFLSTFVEKSAEELDRGQHYADSREYKAYHAGLRSGADFWCRDRAEVRGLAPA